MDTAITKKGSKYLRKTLYQIILPVISNNKVFYAYYTKKLNEGKVAYVLKVIVSENS